jgi:tRNA 2-thiouridine synthesizing protein A
MTPDSRPPARITLDLRGLKCPLPALRTRKALAAMSPGDVLAVEATDPMSAIDIPHLVRETGDTLEASTAEHGVLRFVIRRG